MSAFSPFPFDIAPGISIQLVEQTPTHIYGRVAIDPGTRGYGFNPVKDPRLIVASPSAEQWLIVYRFDGTDPDSALKELEHIALAIIALHATPWRDLFSSPVTVYFCLALMCALDYFRDVPRWILVLDALILLALSLVVALYLVTGGKKKQP